MALSLCSKTSTGEFSSALILNPSKDEAASFLDFEWAAHDQSAISCYSQEARTWCLLVGQKSNGIKLQSYSQTFSCDCILYLLTCLFSRDVKQHDAVCYKCKDHAVFQSSAWSYQQNFHIIFNTETPRKMAQWSHHTDPPDTAKDGMSFGVWLDCLLSEEEVDFVIFPVIVVWDQISRNKFRSCNKDCKAC